MRVQKGIYSLIIITILVLTMSCVPNEINSGYDHTEFINEPLEENNMLLVAVFDFPPYMNVSEEEISGPSIDILHEVFSRLDYEENVDYRLVVYPWIRTLELAKVGEIDIVAQILKRPERMEYLDYTNEYHADEQLVFITLKDRDINFDGTLETLKPYTIGTMIKDLMFCDSMNSFNSPASEGRSEARGK